MESSLASATLPAVRVNPVAAHALVHACVLACAQMLTYLNNGSFLHRQLTDRVTADLLTYNPDLLVFGLWRGAFTWARDGFITLKHQFHALPAIDYTK